MSGSKWLLGLMLATAILAGCTDDGGKLSQEEAENLVEKAIDRLQDDLQDPEGGALSKITGEFSGEMGAGELLLEFGSNGVVHTKVSMGAAGITMAIHMWCTEDSEILQFGEDIFESMRDPDETCLDMGDDETEDSETGLPDPMELDELERASIEPQDDGSVLARLEEEGSEITLTVSPEGRVVRMTVAGEGEADFEFSYGDRKKISPPEATARKPTQVEAEKTFEADTVTWDELEVEGTPPLTQFEVHVYARSETAPQGPFQPSYGELQVSFSLEVQQQTESGYTFTFVDDGDGVLSDGDSFDVVFPEGTSPYEYEVALYDEWAENTTDAQPIPSVSGAFFGLLLLAGLAVLRRRT